METSHKMPVVKANGSQRTMLYWEQFSPVNACHVLELGQNCPITAERFRVIVPQVLRRLGIGNVTADAQSDRYQIEVEGECEITVESVSMNFEQEVEGILDHEFHRPFARNSCPVQFVWAEQQLDELQPSPIRRLFIVSYRHAIADGSSIRVLCQQLLAAFEDRPHDGAMTIYEGQLWKDLQRIEHPPGLWGMISSTVSGLLGLTRCVYPKLRNQSSYDRSVTKYHAESIPVARIRETAANLNVTVHDLLFAATLEGLSREDAIERRGRIRSQMALGSPVDLRQYMGDLPADLFGQLLGTFQVRSDIQNSSFRKILSCVHQQTAGQKERKDAAYYPFHMAISALVSRTLPGESGIKVSRSTFPILGAISNSNLVESFRREFESGVLVRYARATHLGNMLPMMLFVTSFGDEMTFMSSRRESYLCDDAMRRIVAHLVHRASGEIDDCPPDAQVAST